MSTDSSKCCFVVTGFGPFHGVPTNPTMLLVQRLERELEILAPKLNFQVIKTLILETSAEAVRKEIDEMHREICLDSNLAGCHVVFLHLGVNYRGKKFHLEKCAYNDATFRVPDERGYQPQGICILDGSTCSKHAKARGQHQFGKGFKTTLNIESICSKLQKNGNAESVCVSNDPGRFVCNYTYCMSMDKCISSAENNQDGNKTKYHSLFIHVPPFSEIPEENQFIFVLEIMKGIQNQLEIESAS